MVLTKYRSFHESLNALAKDEKYATYEAVNSVEQGQNALPGLHDEPLHGKSEGFRSFRVNQDVRVIYRPFGDEGVLCYVGHHADAYRWAETHRCNQNPVTHLVQVYEDVAQAPTQPVAATAALPPAGDRPYPFGSWPSDDDLRILGVPSDQMALVRGIRNEDDLVEKGEQMPQGVWDILVDLIGEPGKIAEHVAAARTSAAALHGGSTLAQQAAANGAGMVGYSFLSGDEELNRMRDGELAAWRVYLHPEQRGVVEKHFKGPVKVVGGAGTSKTVVALHRVKWLLEHTFAATPQKVLLTTYTNTMAGDLRKLLAEICSEEQMKRVDVQTLDRTVGDFLKGSGIRAPIDYSTERDQAKRFMSASMNATGGRGKFKVGFFLDEYEQVVEADGLATEADYLAASRRGRSVSVTAEDRRRFWPVFVKFREMCAGGGRMRRGEAFNRATALLRGGKASPYAAVVVDESQDLDAPALRFVAALSGNSATATAPDSLVLVGDAHQRIYGRRVSFAACGIQTRGRSKTLKVNYRSTQKIRLRAESVLAGVSVDDLDEEVISFRGGRSLVLGEEPEEVRFGSEAAMNDRIKQTISRWKKEDNERVTSGHEKTWSDYAVLMPSNGEAEKMVGALDRIWVPSELVSGNNVAALAPDHVRVMTMHRAKGLEFSGVVVVLNADKWPRKPADFGSLPEAERELLVSREKSLLYVAMTRAISHVLVTGVGDPPPEFPAKTLRV